MIDRVANQSLGLGQPSSIVLATTSPVNFPELYHPCASKKSQQCPTDAKVDNPQQSPNLTQKPLIVDDEQNDQSKKMRYADLLKSKTS